MKTGFVVLLFAFTLQGCAHRKHTSLEAEPIPVALTIPDLSSLRPVGNVNIKSVLITGNQITLLVTYSGGNEEHTFLLYGAEKIEDGDPRSRKMMLFHDSKKDDGRELIEEAIVFDISLLGIPGEELILILEGFDGALTYKRKN